MKVLIFSGEQNTGKTLSQIELRNFIISLQDTAGNKVFNEISHNPTGNQNNKQKDFQSCLEGINALGNKIKIIISSEGDMVQSIKNLQSFYKTNTQNGSCDILITACRDIDENFQIRTRTLTAIKNLPSQNIEIIELPLAKLTRQNGDLYEQEIWYHGQILELSKFILKQWGVY